MTSKTNLLKIYLANDFKVYTFLKYFMLIYEGSNPYLHFVEQFYLQELHLVEDICLPSNLLTDVTTEEMEELNRWLYDTFCEDNEISTT